MQITSSISELRAILAPWRKQSIALVPTMGNLHAGHLKLVEQALTRSERVVVSIFVNPLQFGAHEDYHSYPRTLEADCEKLSSTGAAVLFTPSSDEIYSNPLSATTRIEVPQLSDILCGACRPGHFVGVATVVNQLFNIVQPDKAWFGQKDYQQLLIIQRMVADLFIPIEILSLPTVRETDGLAMSSRNHYLTVEQRATAPRLFQIIEEVRNTIEKNGPSHLPELENQALDNLRAAGLAPDYVKVLNAATLGSPSPNDPELIVLAAARLGKTRLIDNVRIKLSPIATFPV